MIEMVKTKWWFTYELTNGDIKVGEIINDDVEVVHIKTAFPKSQVDMQMRMDEALALAQGIIKTAFEIEYDKVIKGKMKG